MAKSLTDNIAYYGGAIDPTHNKLGGGLQDLLNVTDPSTGSTFNLNELGQAAGSTKAVLEHGFGMDSLFNIGKGQALSTLMNALGVSSSFMQGPNPVDEQYARNLVGLGVGQVGAQALRNSQAARENLAASGIGGNSPIAAGVGSRLAASNDAAVRNAQLSSETEYLKLAEQRRLAGLTSFNNLSNNIAQVQLQVPQYATQAMEELPEFLQNTHLAHKEYDLGKEQASQANLGQMIGLGGSLLKFGAGFL